MNKKRCSWVTDNVNCISYHDNEWGIPVYNDDIHFEFLVLESFQAGLSWSTVLNKRKNFKTAFDDFNYRKIAKYKQDKINELLQNKNIIRNKLKINATINNAKCFLKVQKEFGDFNTYIWSFTNNKPIINSFNNVEEIPANTNLSDTISKDLKKRGFKFIGTTIVYAYLQAIGIVMNHTTDCYKYDILNKIN